MQSNTLLRETLERSRAAVEDAVTGVQRLRELEEAVAKLQHGRYVSGDGSGWSRSDGLAGAVETTETLQRQLRSALGRLAALELVRCNFRFVLSASCTLVCVFALSLGRSPMRSPACYVVANESRRTRVGRSLMVHLLVARGAQVTESEDLSVVEKSPVRQKQGETMMKQQKKNEETSR